MKKATSLLLILSFIFSFCACGNSDNDTQTTLTTNKAKQYETATEATHSTSNESTTIPSPSPMDIGAKKLVARYGKKTGTDKTYTGLEPLKPRTMPVIDPQNTRNLSTTTINHAYGVAKDEKPHEISVNNQKLYEKYGGICYDTSTDKVIYLTFDCGYENGNTEKILDTLKEKKIPAAFFVTLPQVKSTPELIARMINEGHIVGNHSVNHPNFSTISRDKMAEEIEGMDNYLREHFGYSAPFFRFPEGACSENALDLVANLEFRSVFWSAAYADWDTNNQKGKQYAFDTVTQRLHPGCVLLLHSVSQDNAEALPDIIEYAEKNGYRFGNLQEIYDN